MKILIFTFMISFNAFAEFDHSHEKLNKILHDYTLNKDQQTYFEYQKFQKNVELLQIYLRELESVRMDEFKKFENKQKLAFWINAYNAYTIQIILENYPLKSIKDISSGWFSSGPWKKEFIKLLGMNMSLDHIEHDELREKFKEPRIHFALNCASIGCPSLLQESFVASKIEEQLNRAAKNFLSNKSKNYLEGKILHLSKIFKWYGSDFKAKYGSYKNYVIMTLGIPQNDYEVEFNDYDWRLNSR